MAILVKMPALSPTMTEGGLAKWLKNEGDEIKSGDVLAEIETDKATMEIESNDDGILLKIIVKEGSENVIVGSPIAIIKEDSDSDTDEMLDNLINENKINKDQINDKFKEADKEKILKNNIVKTELGSSDIKENIDSNNKPTRIFASPLAKRLAQENNIKLSEIKGTGPKGRILKDDVNNILNRNINIQNINISNNHQRSFEDKPHTNMRKIISDRLKDSKINAPHFYLTIDCQVDNLLLTRKILNAKNISNQKISVNDFIVKASALALIEVPQANCSWMETFSRYYNYSDISVAVAIPDGLITPVLKNVNQKGLLSISNEIKTLADKAKKGELKKEEYIGGNLTVSNLGMFGIKSFTAIINPPQSMILAVGQAEKKPIVIDGEIQIKSIITFTLSCDHRVVDGALGAKWLQSFKEMIENPSLMLL